MKELRSGAFSGVIRVYRRSIQSIQRRNFTYSNRAFWSIQRSIQGGPSLGLSSSIITKCTSVDCRQGRTHGLSPTMHSIKCSVNPRNQLVWVLLFNSRPSFLYFTLICTKSTVSKEWILRYSAICVWFYIRQQQPKFAKNLQGHNFCAIMN